MTEAVRCGCGTTFSRATDQPWRRLCVPCWLRSRTPPGAPAPAPRAPWGGMTGGTQPPPWQPPLAATWERRGAAPVPPPPAPAAVPHVEGRDHDPGPDEIETQEEVTAALRAALARTSAEAARHRDRADAAEAHGARLLVEIGRLRAAIENAEGSIASVRRRNAEMVRELVELRIENARLAAGRATGKTTPNLSATEWRAVIRLLHPDRQGVIGDLYRDEADSALKLLNGLRERLGK